MRLSRPVTRAVAIAAAIVALVLTAGSACERRQDADVSDRNTGPAEIINMPDGYSNVASKCDGPNRVYTIFHGKFDDPMAYGSVAVVANDPRCTGKPQ